MKAEPVAVVGDVAITRVGEYEQARDAEIFFDDPGDVRRALADERWLSDFGGADGRLRVMIQAFVVETPDMVILVDPCIGDDRTRERMFPEKPPHTTFLEDLTDAVGDLRRIDVVAFTHLHLDHVGWSTTRVGSGWTPTFPWARYIIAGDEWEHWRSTVERGPETDFTHAIDESIRPLFDHELVELVDGDHVITDGVRLRNTSGHSPGHVSLDIDSNGRRAVITGDILHHPVQVYEPRWPTRAGIDADSDRAVRVRVDLIDELTDTETLMIGTHFAGCCAGHVERDDRGSRRFRVVGAP